MSPLTAGERIALVAVVETSRIPGKARLLAALDQCGAFLWILRYAFALVNSELQQRHSGCFSGTIEAQMKSGPGGAGNTVTPGLTPARRGYA